MYYSNETLENPMSKLFKYLSISIVFMFIGYVFGLMFMPVKLVYMANILVSFLITGLLIMSLFSKSIIPQRFSINFVYLFTFVEGLLSYPIITYYVGSLGTGVVINVLVITIAIFSTLSFVASKDEGDKYLKLGPILFASLVGLFIASIINIFVFGKVMNILLSAFGVVIFSGYILYDISIVKYRIMNCDIRDSKDLSIHVLNLYLDFVNIFMDLLRLVKEFSD